MTNKIEQKKGTVNLVVGSLVLITGGAFRGMRGQISWDCFDNYFKVSLEIPGIPKGSSVPVHKQNLEFLE